MRPRTLVSCTSLLASHLLAHLLLLSPDFQGRAREPYQIPCMSRFLPVIFYTFSFFSGLFTDAIFMSLHVDKALSFKIRWAWMKGRHQILPQPY